MLGSRLGVAAHLLRRRRCKFAICVNLLSRNYRTTKSFMLKSLHRAHGKQSWRQNKKLGQKLSQKNPVAFKTRAFLLFFVFLLFMPNSNGEACTWTKVSKLTISPPGTIFEPNTYLVNNLGGLPNLDQAQWRLTSHHAKFLLAVES